MRRSFGRELPCENESQSIFLSNDRHFPVVFFLRMQKSTLQTCGRRKEPGISRAKPGCCTLVICDKTKTSMVHSNLKASKGLLAFGETINFDPLFPFHSAWFLRSAEMEPKTKSKQRPFSRSPLWSSIVRGDLVSFYFIFIFPIQFSWHLLPALFSSCPPSGFHAFRFVFFFFSTKLISLIHSTISWNRETDRDPKFVDLSFRDFLPCFSIGFPWQKSKPH